MNQNYCVILAAGLSSRMGAYKPLLNIQGTPAILYLVQHLYARRNRQVYYCYRT